ncbi:hypothetical protein Goklo_023920 [Gossypium klotzschianum]|uniref:Retrotransposon gag domain-containing protein n=1 Tax=Gossypium klotzschianum TaxID=34286 RepID=A0A7J8W7Z8_9ROSI|nr:hypothetical protein [Gossypium klotzschianum]
MFPNRRSLRVHDPQGMWITSYGKWSPWMRNMVGNAIGTWEEFQKEVKKQFYPQYAENKARAKLHRLTQQCTV